jgi:hypothetical protein
MDRLVYSVVPVVLSGSQGERCQDCRRRSGAIYPERQ